MVQSSQEATKSPTSTENKIHRLVRNKSQRSIILWPTIVKAEWFYSICAPKIGTNALPNQWAHQSFYPTPGGRVFLPPWSISTLRITFLFFCSLLFLTFQHLMVEAHMRERKVLPPAVYKNFSCRMDLEMSNEKALIQNPNQHYIPYLHATSIPSC